MGCDIHAMIEKKEKDYDWWINAGDPEIGRDYLIFAVLANVRNYDNVPYISAPRGVPSNACSPYRAWSQKMGVDGHSHSWLLLRELKEFDIEQEYESGALILDRDEEGNTTSTCRATFGAHQGRVGKTTVFGIWGPERWQALIDKMEKLGKDDEVRLVFYFDN